jgi:hypothetical protein
MRLPVRRVGRIDTHISRAPPAHGSVRALGEPTHGVGLRDDVRGADCEHTPTLAQRLVHVVGLEGDLRSDSRRGHGVGRGPKDDRVLHDLVVDRDDRGTAIRRRHRDAPHAVRGQQAAAFLPAEVTQLRMQ